MHRPTQTALLFVTVATAACVDPGEPTPGTSTAAIIGDQCDYITCGRNTAAIGNGKVDQVYFDGTPNDRGQVFVSWRGAGGETITPVLSSRSLGGAVGNLLRVGDLLNGSVITLSEDGQPVKLRFVDAERPTLPNGLDVWVYRLDVWRSSTGWQPLCPLFDHTDDVIARYAIPGTREVVHARTRAITSHAPSAGRLTLGCPSSATGKMLSLGALTTTAATGEVPTLSEMQATLLALTLSPTGGRSYTHAGVPVMFSVTRTGVDNNSESFSGGLEGAWDRDGAICFTQLRGIDADAQWELWSDTHVPSCDDVDLSEHTVLVTTHRYFGVYPAYPPPPPPLGGLITP